MIYKVKQLLSNLVLSKACKISQNIIPLQVITNKIDKIVTGRKLNILISNDDGYTSRGIHTLANIMSAFGEITVVAPKYHQSAMSMAVSLGMKRIAYKELPGEGPGRWSYLDATPASCIKFGLEYKYPHRDPDVVVSGINHGSNAATAANYSATLGCADEGALNGIKSIGVSLQDFDPEGDLSAVEKYFPAIFEFLMDNWPENVYGLVYNVNFPKAPADKIKGVRIARQGRGHWEKEYQPWDEEKVKKYFVAAGCGFKDSPAPLEDGETAFMMVGNFIDDEDSGHLNADHRLNNEGWITITPNTIDRTDFAEVKRLSAIIENNPIK